MYMLIVFVSMILHELSHVVIAKILGEKGTVRLFSRKRLLVGLRLELEKYSSTNAFLSLKREDKIRYAMIALAPYWLFVFGYWLIYSSYSMACVYAGYVIIVFHIVNLPLEFINF